MELAAQIVGFCGTAGLFISYQQNTKNRILLFQIIGITMFTLHFFLLSAWSGCMMNLLGIGRALLYAYTEQKGLHVRWLCPLLCAVFTAAAVLTWESAFSLLPTAAMLLSTLAYEQKQPRRFRRLMFPCSPLWMVYNIHSGSVTGVVTEAFAMLSLGVAMWRYDRAPKSE